MAENCNECSIAWIRGGEYAEVSAHNGSKMKGRVLKLAKQHPENVKVLATNKDGSIFAHVPVKYVKLRAPRELTEEQRAELVERGKNMSRNKSVDYEETSDFDFDDEDEEILDSEDKIKDAVNLVRAFAKCPDRTALTDSFIESLKLLADTVESQMEEVK